MYFFNIPLIDCIPFCLKCFINIQRIPLNNKYHCALGSIKCIYQKNYEIEN